MNLKNIVVGLFLLLLGTAAYGQNIKKKIFFVADTINVDKNSRLVEIGNEGRMNYYAFLCRCVAPYHQYPAFSYKVDVAKIEILAEKPKEKYTSLSDLLDLLRTYGNRFDEHYKLQIIELLPNKTYQMVDNLAFVKQNKQSIVN